MNSRRSTLLTLLASAATSAVGAASTAWDPRRRPDVDPREEYFTNAEFIDHEGKQRRFYEDIIHNKLVVVNMMYTACTSTCPANTASLLKVQEALGDRIGRDVHMVSLSLLPELDSPSALRTYMKRHGIGPGWIFLTGTRPPMDLVRRKLGFYDTDPAVDADLFRHTGMLSIGNDRIERWCMVPALSATHQIVRTIEEMA